MTDHTIPPGYYVRYDYHEKPVAITAILFESHGHIAAVGVAKFSARDTHFSFETGEQIALGRALRHLKDGYGVARRPKIEVAEITPLAEGKVPGYISGNLTEAKNAVERGATIGSADPVLAAFLRHIG